LTFEIEGRSEGNSPSFIAVFRVFPHYPEHHFIAMHTALQKCTHASGNDTFQLRGIAGSFRGV